MTDPRKFKAPYNPKERIWQEADRVRAAHPAGRSLPVEVLDLAEFDLGLDLIKDLIPEDPTGRIGNRYTIKDFVSASARTIIEAKFVRDKDHGKSISKELHDDIETYRHHTHCDNIIFFIYDPDTHIPDCDSLKRAIHAARVYDGQTLNVLLLIKP